MVNQISVLEIGRGTLKLTYIIGLHLFVKNKINVGVSIQTCLWKLSIYNEFINSTLAGIASILKAIILGLITVKTHINIFVGLKLR